MTSTPKPTTTQIDMSGLHTCEAVPMDKTLAKLLQQRNESSISMEHAGRYEKNFEGVSLGQYNDKVEARKQELRQEYKEYSKGTHVVSSDNTALTDTPFCPTHGTAMRMCDYNTKNKRAGEWNNTRSRMRRKLIARRAAAEAKVPTPIADMMLSMNEDQMRQEADKQGCDIHQLSRESVIYDMGIKYAHKDKEQKKELIKQSILDMEDDGLVSSTTIINLDDDGEVSVYNLNRKEGTATKKKKKSAKKKKRVVKKY